MTRGTRTRLLLLALALWGLYAVQLAHTPPHLHRDEVVPDRALILMSRDDERLVAMVRSGQLTELASIPEPADPPYYAVVERRR